MTKTSVDGNSQVQADEDVVAHKIQDEEVLLQLSTGRYYGLDECGSLAWSLLTEKRQTIAAAARAIAAEFETEPERAEADLLRLVRELAQAQLITVSDSSA